MTEIRQRVQQLELRFQDLKHISEMWANLLTENKKHLTAVRANKSLSAKYKVLLWDWILISLNGMQINMQLL